MTFELAETLFRDTHEKEETITLNGDSSSWPAPIDEAAYQGLAGEIVKAIEPHTEADPVAILIQTLTFFGNIIGDGPHFRVEADRHPLRLFSVIVGQSSKSRKGTSEGIVKRLFHDIDEEWARERIKGGLSSGEGLAYHVRDAGTIGKYEDSGVSDKRLLVCESEFASVLKSASRDGNILSPVIRQAWDTGNLQTLTKNNPVKATGAHVSISAHITEDELRRYLSQTEMFNGFGNRFIWLCVKRSKVLPEGGMIHQMDLSSLSDRIRDAVQFAKRVDEITRDEESREIWKSIYEELSEGKRGLIGAILSRAEAQVMRLSCVYALMDRSRVVRAEHLHAALALWDYAEASVNYIFRGKTGDEVADRIHQALSESENGLTRTDINNLFGGHKSTERIDEALELLKTYKKINIRKQDTGGRPTERIFRGAE